jgi:hypothetical protein
MLYDVNDTLKIQPVYNESPRYVTKHIRITEDFSFENLKAGKISTCSHERSTIAITNTIQKNRQNWVSGTDFITI